VDRRFDYGRWRAQDGHGTIRRYQRIDELMQDLDPEEACAIVNPALKIVVDAVKRYEGYVVQSTGDGIFALFGTPMAHEDHPQRGLYAALQMQQQLREYGQRRTAQGAHALEVRVGINTGEVVVWRPLQDAHRRSEQD
jgi:class 3 adenylate cyclase